MTTMMHRRKKKPADSTPKAKTPKQEKRGGNKDSKGSPPRKSGGIGTRLLTDAEIARLEGKIATGNMVAASLAQFRLNIDHTRRVAADGRARRAAGENPGKNTVHVTVNGVAGPAGGRSRAVGVPVEYRATTAQAAGLWPWPVAASVPVIGTPLGEHLHTGEPVCFDPLSWFKRGLITAPSLFVLGLNGFGKSSLVRRMVLGAIAQGVTPLILADVKPDYVDTIRACGGQVIDLGYGKGQINPLDPGVMGMAVNRLRANGFDEYAESLTSELRARTTNLVCALIELSRGRAVEDFEETMISTALRILYTPVDQGGRGFTLEEPPILTHLAEVLKAGSEELREDAVQPDYDAATIRLRQSLRALTQGPFGRVFNGPTTTPIDFNSTGVTVDVSHIPKSDRKLKAAVMLTTWSAGFGAVEALNLLAEDEIQLEPQRYFMVVMDELWQVLGLGPFMVDRVDELTRLQRALATALIMISHSMRDLQGLTGDAASKAVGFLERARVKIFGALPPQEIVALRGISTFTRQEAAMITSWSAPQALVGDWFRPGADGTIPVAPGVGNFILKTGEDAPGIPFHQILTRTERAKRLHDTSKIFDSYGRQPTAPSSGRA